jgi:hypothetical protein
MPTSTFSSNANRADLKPSSKSNPCPICGRMHDGDCRISNDLVLCHHGSNHHPPHGVRPGEVPANLADTSKHWAYAKETEDGRAAVYVIDKPIPGRPLQRSHTRAAAASRQATRAADPITLARLPEPGAEPPAHWPDSKRLDYSSTQRVEVRVRQESKSHLPCHLAGDAWASNAGPDPWPLWREVEALEHGRGQWIAEAEGEKCADWLRAAGLVAVSQPGHDHKAHRIEDRYRRLQAAGIKGIAYLADNDDQGRRKAKKCAEAADAVGLQFLVLHAAEVWPGLAEKGSVDDAPGTATERAQAFEQAAIAAAMAAPEAGPAPMPGSDGKAHQRRSGRCRQLRPSEVLEQLPGRIGVPRLNLRSGEVRTDTGVISANEIARLYLTLSDAEETWPKETTADAITELAARNSYDPVAEYLNAMDCEALPLAEWQRLDRHLLGINDPIAAAFLPRYLISAVARALQPGCSVRQIPVLVGAQWRGKTALGRILFGAEHWVEGVGRLDRDDLMKARSAWGVELAELDGVTRRSDQEHLKAFLTETVDTYRAPYDRAPERHPRRFVFWATSNGPPLRDATGSTRFVCIHLPDRNLPLEWAEKHRSAIWARAVEQYRAGTDWDFCSEEERQTIAARNSDFQELDPITDLVAQYLDGRRLGGILPVQVSEVLCHLGVPAERQSTQWAKRVRQQAESLGWKYDRRLPGGGRKKARGLWPEPTEPSGPPGPSADHPPDHPENPVTAMDLPPWTTQTTQVEKRGSNTGDIGKEKGSADAIANRGTFSPAGWSRGSRLKNHCDAVDPGEKVGGPRVVCGWSRCPDDQADKVAAQPEAPRPGAAITAKGPTAKQTAALARLLQEKPDSHPATLALLLDPDGSAGLTGRDVKLWIDSGLAGAVA